MAPQVTLTIRDDILKRVEHLAEIAGYPVQEWLA